MLDKEKVMDIVREEKIGQITLFYGIPISMFDKDELIEILSYALYRKMEFA